SATPIGDATLELTVKLWDRRRRYAVGFIRFLALFRKLAQGKVFAVREAQAHGNAGHERDEPKENSATNRQFRWDAVNHLQRADHGKLAAATDRGQLHHRADHAEAH